MTTPYIPEGFIPISGHFEYRIPSVMRPLVFDWDGAAIGPSDEVVIVEEELCQPVALHVQGHLARVAIMAELGERIRKTVWVVSQHNFDEVWRIVETWCEVLASLSEHTLPLNEYWTRDGDCLAMSPRIRSGQLGVAQSLRSEISTTGGVQ